MTAAAAGQAGPDAAEQVVPDAAGPAVHDGAGPAVPDAAGQAGPDAAEQAVPDAGGPAGHDGGALGRTRRRRADRKRRRRADLAIAAVGVVGELLITLGVLLGLFLVWQLWWTDVVAEREQAQFVADLGWAVTPDRPAPDPDGSEEPQRHTDPAPVMEEPALGTTFATLHVPRWGEDYVRPISQGTTKRDILDVLGLGHYEGTAMPGGIGNFAVAGHRVTYGKPLNRIEELEVGDPLVVQTKQTWYVYRVTATSVVGPRQVDVIAPVPGAPEALPTEALMTLTTCHPMYSAQERYIVHAELEYWLPTSEGVPPEIEKGA